MLTNTFIISHPIILLSMITSCFAEVSSLRFFNLEYLAWISKPISRRLYRNQSLRFDDQTKLKPVALQRPLTRGRSQKYNHPLFEKEKHLESVVRRILPKEITDSVCKKGSRLAPLYGLPKTHKERLAFRPILSTTYIYYSTLAKCLNEKLKTIIDQ